MALLSIRADDDIYISLSTHCTGQGYGQKGGSKGKGVPDLSCGWGGGLTQGPCIKCMIKNVLNILFNTAV